MKKTLYFIAIFSLSGFCFAGGSYYRVVGVANNDTLSVRQYPSASSKKVASLLPYDTGITVSKCKKIGHSRWCKVDFLVDDIMFFVRDLSYGGWVNAKYLKPASNIIYSSAMEYRSNHNIFKVVGVKYNDVLNVRKHPRYSSKKIGYLKYNDVGIVAAKCQRVGKSSWCYVAYDYNMELASGPGSEEAPYAKLGWVNMRYLKLYNGKRKSRLPGMTFPGEVY